MRHVARTYARAERAIIFWGMGISQHIHGTDNARCLIALAMITGQVGRPGTGLHPLRGQNNVQGASDAGLIPMVYPDYQSVANPDVRAKFEGLWQTSLDDKPGLTVVEIMDAVHRDEIRGMYIMGENPAMSDPDVQHARDGTRPSRAPRGPGHFPDRDREIRRCRACRPRPGRRRTAPSPTPTARCSSGGAPCRCRATRAQDLWIIQEIARRIGLDWSYTHPRDVFAEMKLAMPSLDNITWERLEREGSVTYPCDAPDKPGNEIVFGDGFPTASGRAKLVPAAIIPPAEEPDADYPMVLTTGRQLEHWHTGAMTRRASVLDEIEPEAVASLAPAELRRLGIAAGESVRVTTRRGMIELKARADSAVAPGQVFVPFCYAEAAANILTNPQLDPFGKIPEFKFCAAKVEPVEVRAAAE